MTNGNADHWTAQSVVTEPGPAAEKIAELPGDLARLRRVSSGLVFHYREGGDFAKNGIAADRIGEIDTRYADAMFARLAELGGPLAGERRAAERLVGCCRDFTVLFVSMARAKGLAARGRVGFARYFETDWYLDHEIAEVWDEARRRWLLVEPQMSDEFAERCGFDPLDLSRDVFFTGAAAWRLVRRGDADPRCFVVHPDLDIPQTRGWPQLRHNLVHDLAALNRQEMVLWDAWGLMAARPEPDEAECRALDELALALDSADPAWPIVHDWASRPDLAVDDPVASYTPAHPDPSKLPLRVALRPGLVG